MIKSIIEPPTQKVITVVSLNLWRFYDWEKRLPTIIKLLKEINPDIICTQETQRNIAIDPRSQIEILNAELGYHHTIFSVADIKHTQKGVALKYPVDHGLGVFSRFPFTSEVISLTKAIDDKERRIILKCEVDIEGTPHTITNLHFSNSDSWAENHFKETLAMFETNIVSSILIGDFNIFDMSKKYHKLYGDKYKSSSDLFDYISYPDDNASLDYALLPNNYEFTNFTCRGEHVSDHRMIVAEIKLPKNI